MIDTRENNKKISRALLVIPVAFLLAYGLMINSVFFLMEGGSAHYLVLARSISSGFGMSEIFLPDPVPHTKTPFMFPLILAGIDLAFGYNMIAVKILLLAFMVMAAAFIYLSLRTQAPLWLAFATTALTLSSPLILSLMKRVLTEIPYLALSFAALYLALKALEGEAKKRDWIILSILFFVSYFTRTIAFTLIAAFIIILLARALRVKHMRKDLAYGIAAALPTLIGAIVWSVRGVKARGAAGLDYMSELLIKAHPYSVLMGATDLEAPLRPEMERAGFIDLIHRMWDQIIFFLRTIAQTLDPWLPMEGPLSGHSIILAVLIILTIMGLVISIRNKNTLIPLYLILFLFVICLWPYRDPRFVLPTLPLFIYLMISGGEKILLSALTRSGLKSRTILFIKPVSAGSLFTMIIFINLIADFIILKDTMTPSNSSIEYKIKPGFNVRTDTYARENLLSNLQWIRQKSPEDSIIMFHSPRVAFLVTGRKCVNVPITKDKKKFWSYVEHKRVDYIIVDELYREIGGGINLFTPEYLIPALNAGKDRYRTEFRVPGSQSAVVRVIRGENSP